MATMLTRKRRSTITKDGLTIEAITQLYKTTRSTGCYANGTLKIGKARIRGWEFVARLEGGTLVVRAKNSETLHHIPIL